MEENYHLGPNAWLSLTSKLLTLFGFFLLGSFLGQFFGLLAVVYIIGFPTANIEQFQKMVMDFMVHPEKYENAFQGMMALQWFTALFTFVLGSWAYLHYIEKRSISDLNVGEAPNWKIFLWAILTILVSMPSKPFHFSTWMRISSINFRLCMMIISTTARSISGNMKR